MTSILTNVQAIPPQIMDIIDSITDKIDNEIFHGIDANGAIVPIYYTRMLCYTCGFLINTIHICPNCGNSYCLTVSASDDIFDDIVCVKYNNIEVYDVVQCIIANGNHAFCFNYNDTYYVICNNNICFAEESSAKWLLGKLCFYRTNNFINAPYPSMIPIWYKPTSKNTQKGYLFQSDDYYYVKYRNDEGIITDARVCQQYAQYAQHLNFVANHAITLVHEKRLISCFDIDFDKFVKSYILDFIKDDGNIITSARNIKFMYIVLPDLSVSFFIFVKIVYKIADKLFKPKEIIRYCSKSYEINYATVQTVAYESIYSAINDPVISASVVANKIMTVYNNSLIQDSIIKVLHSDVACDFKVDDMTAIMAHATVGITVASLRGFGIFSIGHTCIERKDADITQIDVLSINMIDILKPAIVKATIAASNQIIADNNGIINAFTKISCINSAHALNGIAGVLIGYLKHNTHGLFFPIKLIDVSINRKFITMEYLLDNISYKNKIAIVKNKPINLQAELIIDGIIKRYNNK
jgi:hypothetical protein